MAPKLKVIISDSFNPHLNIATEEWIFNEMDPSAQTLFLWRNEPTVVIGRSQNPWSECNLAQMKADGVHLARRATGGGAVFHDLGNTCFTFLSPKDSYKRENNIAIIQHALAKVGITSMASGRNDLLLEAEDGPRKFSGSAYREKRDRAFHHGTLLINADLGRLAQYLTPNPKKLQAKGKESVRMRVANLSEHAPNINHEALVELLVASIENFYGGAAEVERLSLETLKSNDALKTRHAELSSWDWLYGHTLDFSHQLDEYLSIGFFDFRFQVGDGVVRDVQIFSDCLSPELINDLHSGLRGQRYEQNAVLELAQALKAKHSSYEAGIDELGQWLARKIEV
jgi:lipoate-protein ligase A